tara:strand:+ start:455 stop:661 length:207 start_codon:yes stop_codon:yes gene_type:complete
MRKTKKYALGGVTIPEQEDSRYRPSANRAAQGIISSRGTTSAMGLYDGGLATKKNYVNPVTIVDNRKK